MTIDDTVERLLTEKPLAGFLATAVDDRPHVAPVWYRYRDGVIEVMASGRKLENIRSNPQVSFAVQRADDGDPEWTVTLLGTAEVVDDDEQAAKTNREINRKYGAPSDAWSGNTLVRITVGSASYRCY